MNSVHSEPMGARERAWRVFGVVPYVLRRGWGQASRGSNVVAEGAVHPTLVLVIPGTLDARSRTLLRMAAQALGPHVGRIEELAVVGGKLAASLPPDAVFMAFGQAQLDAVNQARTQAHLDAVLVDGGDPQALHGAAGKRRLWQAMREIRHALDAAPGVAWQES